MNVLPDSGLQIYEHLGRNTVVLRLAVHIPAITGW